MRLDQYLHELRDNADLDVLLNAQLASFRWHIGSDVHGLIGGSKVSVLRNAMMHGARFEPSSDVT
jgi:hypothetical protein